METLPKSWTVIKFPDEDSVCAVPSSWIVQGGSKCYWPPYSKKMVRATIEKNEAPDTANWQLYSCTGFRNNVYDTFKDANRKSLLATKSSDLDSCSEAEPHSRSSKNRKIFRKTFSFSSVEEEDGNESILPSPPQYREPQRKLVQNEARRDSIFTDSDSAISRPSCSKPQDHSLEQISRSHTFESQSGSYNTDAFTNLGGNENESDLKKIIKYLENLTRKQNILQATMIDISNRLVNIENHQRPVANVETMESIFVLVNNLPVNNNEELESLENYLENKLDSAIEEISKIGGSTIYDFIVRATYKLIRNGYCGQEFSYEGKRQKKAFRNLKLNELLIKSSMALFKGVTMKEAETNVQKWIRRCTERAKSAKKN